MMALFGRRRVPADESPVADESVETTEMTDEEADDGRGPWDITARPRLGQRVDLGALRVPAREGMALRLGVEQNPHRIVAANIQMKDSALEVRAFAAPRSDGIWDEIRAEILASVTKQGGTADQVVGPFGQEVLARLPIRTPEGRTGHRAARFVGVDGNRWFLRGVITGKAATDPTIAADLESVFADVVVVRGQDARVPRDLLTLTMPGEGTAEDAADSSLDPFERGPEITEVY